MKTLRVFKTLQLRRADTTRSVVSARWGRAVRRGAPARSAGACRGAEDGTARTYIVQVKVAPASGNLITLFSVQHAQGTNLSNPNPPDGSGIRLKVTHTIMLLKKSPLSSGRIFARLRGQKPGYPLQFAHFAVEFRSYPLRVW